MRNHAKWRGLFLATAAIAALAVLAVLGALTAPRLRAQTPAGQSPATPAPTAQSLEAMEAAGIKMSFDVASVKPNKSGDRSRSSNVPLEPLARYSPTGGLFSATNYSLVAYLSWAYDMTGDQMLHLMSELPSWAVSDSSGSFDIEARAQGNPTKAQMQLMMQSLLADRFKLVVHTETKQAPVYALVLSKPGKTGPQLRPHVDDGSCSAATPAPGAATPKSATSSADLPPVCSTGIVGMPPSAPGRLRMGARNVTIGMLADFLPLTNAKFSSRVDRPVLDRTGLSGNFDFSIEFVLEFDGPPPPNFQPDPSGPTFLEALQEQLGLKLVPQTGPVDVIVIDHVEEPSPN
jgi:uncharacterized protein (TIGR03435 family)